MRPETQNGEAIPRLRDLRTRSITASVLPPPPRESRRAVATPGSQFQKGAPAPTKVAGELRVMQQLFVFFEIRISNFQFRFAVDPASEGRKDRERKTGRTSQSCIVR